MRCEGARGDDAAKAGGKARREADGERRDGRRALRADVALARALLLLELRGSGDVDGVPVRDDGLDVRLRGARGLGARASGRGLRMGDVVA